MGDQHLTYFKVENFKRFSSFEMEELGQFNLLVGDNNVGKTSVLEALLVDDNIISFFSGLKYILCTIKKFNNLSTENAFDFYVNSQNDDTSSVFKFNTKMKGNEKKFILEKTESKQVFRWLISSKNSEGIINVADYKSNEDVNYLDLSHPFLPYGFSYDHRLTYYYSSYIQLSNSKKEYFIAGLKKIIPRLKGIEVNAAFAKEPILLVSQEGHDSVLPLATFGDGFLKLFRLLIAIVVHRGKRLMIDEVEAGIHYSRMKEFWKVIFEAAIDNDVQLFATTHSKECMESYTHALNELKLENQGRIIRLADTKKGIKAFTMKYAEFENAFLAESEIR